MHNSKKILLEIQDLSLAFPLRLITSSSLRDVFVNTMMGPLSKKYERGSFLALNNINLTVYEGDRIGLVGVNGAGKSTLCRCISGFYQPKIGKVLRNGGVRALFESTLGLYPELSGRENAKILAEIYYPQFRNKLEEIVEESLEFSELKSFIDAPIKTYSKGMMVRLTLSLLSAKPADILILDEVFDGADEFFREKLSVRIKNLIEQSGAVIFVSHYEAQVYNVSNRAVVIGEGQILYDGEIKDAYDLYRTIKNEL
ncbi:MAG: ATP-binding cassette domain-containing protein [Bacteriovorax sp.]|nr:ATP-binding cassette domain-containing protein [Bacteriovorax sp.]